ncbi:P-loop containing nucleoside triphosphate hydrolase protein [Pisolithus tinctorius]|nr:P-loop containing nucleoside triphosphate hydrolase protein [Pisolithus tinctorius]
MIRLRPYQEACLEACRAALAAGRRRIGVSLPTGAGKTTVFLTLLSRIAPPEQSPSAAKSLIIVNNIELARQAAVQAARLFPDWRVEIEQGAKHRASGLADVTVATVQTLLQPQRLEKFRPETLKAVVVDEAHHAAAPSYRRILSHFDMAIKNPGGTFPKSIPPHPIPVIGFSATFSRHDGLALGSVFQEIVYHHDFLQMIKEQWLCDVRFTTVHANIDLRDVTINTKTGDFNASSLAHVVSTDTVNNLVVRVWMDRAGDRRSTLVFCVNRDHVRRLTQTFRDFGIEAHYVHAGTPPQERQALITDFKAGLYPVLINCAILTEGADIPNIDCVVIARPTRSRNLFAQMIGRGLRQSPTTGKVDCRIIDFIDTRNRIPGVFSTPTLFGLDPAEVIDDKSLNELEANTKSSSTGDAIIESSSINTELPDPKSVTYIDYEDPFAFVDNFSGAPHVLKLTSNAWVGCGGDVYVLECLGRGYVRIEPFVAEGDPARYRATFTEATMDGSSARAMKLSPYMRKRVIMTSDSLSNIFKGCDTYVARKVLPGSQSISLLRTALWRKAPASPSQKTVILKRWGKCRDDTIQKLETLSKGEAANIITRLRHGAQAHYEKKAKEARKQSLIAEKENERKKRELVRVGPL